MCSLHSCVAIDCAASEPLTFLGPSGLERREEREGRFSGTFRHMQAHSGTPVHGTGVQNRVLSFFLSFFTRWMCRQDHGCWTHLMAKLPSSSPQSIQYNRRQFNSIQYNKYHKYHKYHKYNVQYNYLSIHTCINP